MEHGRVEVVGPSRWERLGLPAFVDTPPRRVLFAGLYAGLTAGFPYGFSIYAPALKQQFGLHQSELMNINTIPFVFGTVSFAFGHATKAFGPAFSLRAGGLVLASSQLFTYALATKMIELPPSLPPAFSLVASSCVGFWGLQLIGSAAFTVPIQHFPARRGDVASIVKSFVGLGGGVTSQLYVVIWGTPTADSTAFNALLLWCGLTLSLNAAGAAFVPTAAEAGRTEPKRMLSYLFYSIVGACDCRGVCSRLSSSAF